jgi:hypothetical protein
MTINDSPNRLAKYGRWLLLIAAFVFFGFLIAGIKWATFARPPLAEAAAAVESDEQVEVVHEPWLIFMPTQSTPDTGFIFYPGGRINPQGYAPLMKGIAAAGYLVIVPEMPINMAVFQPNIADEIMDVHPGIRHWAIGGHSVGGTMAALSITT